MGTEMEGQPPVTPSEASPSPQADEVSSPEEIKKYLIEEKDKLKRSSGGPIEDKYLGEEMLVPLLKTLSEANTRATQQGLPRPTLAFAKAEWSQHKIAWLQKFNAPTKQKPQARA